MQTLCLRQLQGCLALRIHWLPSLSGVGLNDDAPRPALVQPRASHLEYAGTGRSSSREIRKPKGCTSACFRVASHSAAAASRAASAFSEAAATLARLVSSLSVAAAAFSLPIDNKAMVSGSHQVVGRSLALMKAAKAPMCRARSFSAAAVALCLQVQNWCHVSSLIYPPEPCLPLCCLGMYTGRVLVDFCRKSTLLPSGSTDGCCILTCRWVSSVAQHPHNATAQQVKNVNRHRASRTARTS